MNIYKVIFILIVNAFTSGIFLSSVLGGNEDEGLWKPEIKKHIRRFLKDDPFPGISVLWDVAPSPKAFEYGVEENFDDFFCVVNNKPYEPHFEKHIPDLRAQGVDIEVGSLVQNKDDATVGYLGYLPKNVNAIKACIVHVYGGHNKVGWKNMDGTSFLDSLFFSLDEMAPTLKWNLPHLSRTFLNNDIGYFMLNLPDELDYEFQRPGFSEDLHNRIQKSIYAFSHFFKTKRLHKRLDGLSSIPLFLKGESYGGFNVLHQAFLYPKKPKTIGGYEGFMSHAGCLSYGSQHPHLQLDDKIKNEKQPILLTHTFDDNRIPLKSIFDFYKKTKKSYVLIIPKGPPTYSSLPDKGKGHGIPLDKTWEKKYVDALIKFTKKDYSSFSPQAVEYYSTLFHFYNSNATDSERLSSFMLRYTILTGKTLTPHIAQALKKVTDFVGSLENKLFQDQDYTHLSVRDCQKVSKDLRTFFTRYDLYSEMSIQKGAKTFINIIEDLFQEVVFFEYFKNKPAPTLDEHNQNYKNLMKNMVCLRDDKVWQREVKNLYKGLLTDPFRPMKSNDSKKQCLPRLYFLGIKTHMLTNLDHFLQKDSEKPNPLYQKQIKNCQSLYQKYHRSLALEQGGAGHSVPLIQELEMILKKRCTP